MADSWIKALVEAIHASHTQAVLYLSGGSSQALGYLLSTPGASNTVLQTQYFKKTQALALTCFSVVGVGFTGSLASGQPKRGYHRFYMSTRTSDRLWVSSVTLSKGLRTREEEDKVSSQFLLKDEELQQLINGEICMKVYPFSSEEASNAERKIILPGSFNPLHDGHLKLLEVATSICSGYPCFEISAINPDKPPLTVSQMKERVKQFEKVGKTVIISNQPFFYKKAEIFPGSVFVIGADTAARIVHPKYYDGDYKKMIEILKVCLNLGCTFLVGGRNVDGVFKERFRMDLSSTEIRRRLGL
ncbi:hypothetical protein ACHQM5_006782 [Ranunculus cassubicifolius]